MTTVRALGRALLARQHLLARSSAPVVDQVAHLVGLQAQNPTSSYLGLWSRVEGFTHADLADALADRRLVRVAAMRSTIHLLTADDARLLPDLHASRIAADLRANADRRRQIGALDTGAVARTARQLLEERPLGAIELGARLAQTYPDVDPPHLAQVARCLLPLVQVPPRGLWGRSGRTTWTTVRAWLGSEQHLDGADRATALEGLVERYLAAFGPATVADVQTWSGLTGLRAVTDRLSDRLVTLAPVPGSGRRDLLDLADAERPDEDVPAPVRFLPDFDNVLLSHADRSRIVSPEVRARLASRNGMPPATVLVDGAVAGTWAMARGQGATGRSRQSHALLRVTPWRPWTRAEHAEVLAEGERLVRFWADSADTHDVVVQ